MAVQEDLVIRAMEKMRKEHTKMGSRNVYDRQKEAFNINIGRDRFEQLAFKNGYRVKRKRNIFRTTWSQTVEIYPDLVSGRIVNDINQVYQSDIFYLKVSSKDFYGISVIDLYSRRLVALHVSKSLKAEENIQAFKQIRKVKTKEELKGCIFHTDRGSQYISDAHKAMLKDLDMKISMCKMPQQNAYAERVQGTIKYGYYFDRVLTEKNITRVTRRIKKLYNEERPHKNLKGKTPMEFEAMIKDLSECEKPQLKVYDWKE